MKDSHKLNLLICLLFSMVFACIYTLLTNSNEPPERNIKNSTTTSVGGMWIKEVEYKDRTFYVFEHTRGIAVLEIKE